jgi:hypothetical protein
MMHTLHFFALSPQAVSLIPDEPQAARVFIRAQGEKIGAMEFPPGASTLFFVAAEELTGEDLASLLSGPVAGAEPTDDEVFGGLDREAMQKATDAIALFLAETPETSAGTVEAAETYNLTVGELWVWMKTLQGLLEKALEKGGEVATVYR